MAEKRQQHYVPKFALRHFAVDKDRRQLNIYLTDNDEIVRGASLRGQCSKPHFYSKQRWVEDDLGNLEGILASVFQEIILSGYIPRKHKANIALSISLQSGRTEKAVESANNLYDKMAKIFLSANLDSEVLRKVQISDQNASLANLYRSIQTWPAIFDMNQYLLVNKTEMPFVFSDNPVVCSNWFFKGRYDRYAAVGTAASGLQILLPINRELAFYLHDHNVYGIAHDENRVELKSIKDIILLNNLQFRNSSKCIYINNYFDNNSIKQICIGEKYNSDPELKRFKRNSLGSYTETERGEYSSVTEPGSEIISMRKPAPEFAIRFKGLSIRTKPSVYDNGSTEGPMRDPAWTHITTRYSKAGLDPFRRIEDFWDFAEKQPEFTHIGPWLGRDSRAVNTQAG
jgi:Protein of unknown function (DUF4238)